MDLNSDKALMMRVKNGDLDKLGLLFERYHRPLFSFFFRMCRDKSLSEDLVQSVFERMLKYRNTYSGSGAFTTWMFSIARNAHIDHYRKQKRRAVSDELFDEEQVAVAPPEYEEQDPQTLRREILKEALSRLDDDKKEAVILSRYEGLKYAEVADVQGCSEGAVKVKIFRAMKELKVHADMLTKDYCNGR